MDEVGYRVAIWEIEGRTRLVHIWPEGMGEARPDAAVMIGGVGWVDVRPDGEPLPETPPPPRFARGGTRLRRCRTRRRVGGADPPEGMAHPRDNDGPAQARDRGVRTASRLDPVRSHKEMSG
jgi:hypothetical protein